MSGYSKTPLWKKIGYKAKNRVYLLNPPENYLSHVVDQGPEGIDFITNKDEIELDIIHIFTKSIQELNEILLETRVRIKQNGMLWISWPKKSSKVVTDLSDGIVRETGLAHQLVDIKVAAIDEIWSGLKFVIPKDLRKSQ